ncbi:MAG TPA: hypothetical protein VFG86_03850, partial [Chloroflexota bacterium]|nr:hypothetical protein [Chloroflexota bacterium]
PRDGRTVHHRRPLLDDFERDTLRGLGPCSVYALAKAAARNYSNVHTDIARLEELGLVERDEEGAVCVPYDTLEILLPLSHATWSP